MAAETGFVWLRPPSAMAKALAKYGERVLIAVHATGVEFGQTLQDDARRSAPWQDRTGNARGGLFFGVDGLGQPTRTGAVASRAAASQRDRASASGSKTFLVIALSHSMDYGKYLELSHGARYAVIMPTMQRDLPQLEAMLQGIFR